MRGKLAFTILSLTIDCHDRVANHLLIRPIYLVVINVCLFDKYRQCFCCSDVLLSMSNWIHRMRRLS